MKKFSRFFIVIIFILSSFLSFHTTHAATFEISGWIPYWRSATGTQEASLHLNQLTEVNPFGYSVKQDGQLFDAAGIDQAPWPAFIAAAHAKGVKIIPTVMWGNPTAEQTVLSNKVLRDAQIRDIVAMVNSHNFDGVDIDYEAKYATTKNYFSLFLKDLYAAMGKKLVDCEVEARTPVTSRYDTVPADYDPLDVSNDYVAINKYCDRVRIMAYDQGRVDLKLDEANPGLYAPVADPKWVKELVDLASKTISKKKIIIGIPTYGYEYQITPGGIGGYSYNNLWAFNPAYATAMAQQSGIIPQRTSAGELAFTATTTNYLTWSDASAINDKITQAKLLGVRGVAIFKIDGGMDPAAWNYIK